jgi:hypothetical protein
MQTSRVVSASAQPHPRPPLLSCPDFSVHLLSCLPRTSSIFLLVKPTTFYFTVTELRLGEVQRLYRQRLNEYIAGFEPQPACFRRLGFPPTSPLLSLFYYVVFL